MCASDQLVATLSPNITGGFVSIQDTQTLTRYTVPSVKDGRLLAVALESDPSPDTAGTFDEYAGTVYIRLADGILPAELVSISPTILKALGGQTGWLPLRYAPLSSGRAAFDVPLSAVLGLAVVVPNEFFYTSLTLTIGFQPMQASAVKAC